MLCDADCATAIDGDSQVLGGGLLGNWLGIAGDRVRRWCALTGADLVGHRIIGQRLRGDAPTSVTISAMAASQRR